MADKEKTSHKSIKFQVNYCILSIDKMPSRQIIGHNYEK